MELMIEAVSFGFETRGVFHQFSATLGAGITWLRGANGKGKTTLLKLAGGALAPGGGRIVFDGVDCAAQPLAYRRTSFYCGGETPELPWLTVQELLDLHVALYPGTELARLNRHLAGFDIAQTLPQAVATLSLGQHKKLQLALALALPVRLLLVDEPFNGLDAAAMRYLREQLEQRAAARDTCIVLTSHLDPQLPLARTLDLDAH
ncbi:MAG: ATP-binding cassette domain-containing protein [Pseudomonadota bacterium]